MEFLVTIKIKPNPDPPMDLSVGILTSDFIEILQEEVGLMPEEFELEVKKITDAN